MGKSGQLHSNLGKKAKQRNLGKTFLHPQNYPLPYTRGDKLA